MFQTILRGLLFAAALLLACPIRYHAASAGLDQSWAVALNYAAQQGLVHGRDLAFTYGPWAWVALPMGSQLAAGIGWQIAMWLLFAAIAAYLYFFRKLSVVNLAIFTACLFAGRRTFTDFGYAGPDSYLSYLVLLLLVCALDSMYWLLALCVAIALTGALFLVKLTAGIFAASAILAWPVGLFLSRDYAKARISFLLALAGIPSAFAVMYLFHAGSLDGFTTYIRAALDISSGFSVAMSGPGETTADLRDAGLLALGFITLAGLLRWRQQKNFAIALAIAGPLFLSFKHAFIRPAGHTEIFFCVVPLLLGAVILTADFRKKYNWPIAAAVAVLAVIWFQREAGMLTMPSLESAAKLADITALKATLDAQGQQALAPDVIPDLPKAPTAVFPFETAIVAANQAPFRTFPVFQTYQAYTPFLDGWNAATLADPAKAPQQIVLHWDIVDGRHPFLDAPALTTAMLRYYDYAADLAGGRMLIKRRTSAPRFNEPRKVREATLEIGKAFALDPSKPMLVRIETKLNLKGRLYKFLWKLPPSQVLLSAKSGRVLAARLIPDVLAGDTGAGLSFMPDSLYTFGEMLRENKLPDPYTELVISGDAAPFYEPTAKVEFFEIPGWELAAAQNAEEHRLETMTNQGEARAAKMDSINDTGVASLAPNEVVTVDAPQGFVMIRGWAFDFFVSKPASAVYLQLDGKELIRTDYGQSRMDNVALFRDRVLEHTGFSAAIPASRLGSNEHHEVRIVVISPDGKKYSTSAQTVRFRLR